MLRFVGLEINASHIDESLVIISFSVIDKLFYKDRFLVVGLIAPEAQNSIEKTYHASLPLPTWVWLH